MIRKMSSQILISTMFLVAGLICCLGEEGNATFGCILRERNALLRFKASFYDPSGRLSSWDTGSDCCEWQDVECDNSTNHVIGLDLQNKRYGNYNRQPANMLHSEKLDSSILDLKHLRYLDLSGNNFNLAFIPSFLESMSQINHLGLSNANFSGVVPHTLGNLSLLSVLDLSHNYYPWGQLIVDDFTWVSQLSSLMHLNLDGLNLSGTSDLLMSLNMLPLLVDLHVSSSGLDNRNLQHACVNFTLSHIEYLDLSNNYFHGELPCFLENLTSLQHLVLSNNNYNSCNQLHLDKLTNLVELDLSSNSIQCNVNSISKFIFDKPHLEQLSLENNSCHGDISKIFLNLSGYGGHKLKYLDLGYNSFYGELPEEIGKIRNLLFLVLNSNLISGPIPTSIGNLSTLAGLSLNDNQLSGEVPTSLGQLSNLVSLSLLNNSFNGTINESHFSNHTKLIFLAVGLSHLKFGVTSNWRPPFQLLFLFIWSCEIVGGEFPQWIRTQKELVTLYMRNSSISGPLPIWLSYSGMTLLDLSYNSIHGAIHDSLCHMPSLERLYLSGNSLSGVLPECWASLTMLYSLSLSSNHLSGVIPNSIGGAYSLQWLQLNDNMFTGELPSTLRNCTQLKVLDIGENSISGDVLEWIGDYLLNLNVLRLSSNEFYGTISSHLCQLSGLQILDLANNNLTGNIPHCFENFTQMVSYNSSIASFTRNSLQLVIKGVVMDYWSTLEYVVYVDLSNNSLVGGIPVELTSLVALHFLNLSYNHLQGQIPQSIGDMISLEALDISNNNLMGNIPGSLSNLNFLIRLNLSNNNLTGEIPRGHQLQTLEDTSIYEGNPGLCGVPLPKKCHEDGSPNAPNHDIKDGEDKTERIWFYGVVATGFTTGFWGVIGMLVLNRGWAYVYFKFTDGIIARILGI